MNDQVKYEKLLFEFLGSGTEFFRWFQGKNTPNILLKMSEHLGAIESAMRSSDNQPAVTEFAYLTGDSLGDLWAKVQRHLAEGWQPHNTLVVSPVDGKTMYFQAVAKQGPKKSPETSVEPK